MIQGQDAFVVCFDITDLDSFFEVSKTLKMLTEIQMRDQIKYKVIVAGLKCD
jgi:GTPase SAR1 family protein